MPATTVDHWVTVSSWWIWIYVSFYIYFIGVYLFSKGLFERQLLFYSYMTSATLSMFTFFVFPTSISREKYLIGHYGYSESMLNFIRSVDASINCLPSMHICLSTIATISVFRISRSLGYGALLWLGLIAYSTMATKQHYFFDVVTGAALGGFTWLSVFFFLKRAESDGYATQRLDP